MIWTIFKREYLNVVRKKSFILGTFLVPFLLVAIMAIGVIVGIASVDTDTYTFLIPKDKTPEIFQQLTDGERIKFSWVDEEVDSLKQDLKDREIIMELPRQLALDKQNASLAYSLTSNENVSIMAKAQVERKLEKIIKEYKVEKAGLSREKLNEISFRLDANEYKVSESGEAKETNSLLAGGIGFVMGGFMFVMLMMYGSFLMQGVIQEKTNRIVEVIVSSVKPFELMLGKVLAMSAVALTQIILWGILVSLGYMAMGMVVSAFIEPDAVVQGSAEVSESEMLEIMEGIELSLQSFNWGILWLFPIYFVGGFLLYGSLMAAAGAAVDNLQDAQQFTWPIVLPLMIPYMLGMLIAQSPNSGIAVFFSMFPLFSPISMLARMGVTAVPWYQVVLSVLLLIGAFLGTVWLAGKIYRTGILMYGKKPSFKEIFRWVRYS